MTEDHDEECVLGDGGAVVAVDSIAQKSAGPVAVQENGGQWPSFA